MGRFLPNKKAGAAYKKAFRKEGFFIICLFNQSSSFFLPRRKSATPAPMASTPRPMTTHNHQEMPLLSSTCASTDSVSGSEDSGSTTDSGSEEDSGTEDSGSEETSDSTMDSGSEELSGREELDCEEGAFTLLETLLGTEATASVTVTSKVTVFSPYLTVMVWVPTVLNTVGSQVNPLVISSVAPLYFLRRRVSPEVLRLSPFV